MELFSVNRYIETETPCKDDNQEDKILEELLRKVHKRKRDLNPSSTDIPANKDDVVETEEAKPSRKKKKRKRDTGESKIEGNNETTTNDLNCKEDNQDVAEKTEKISEQECTKEGEPGFQVLGHDVTFEKKQEVDAALPPWLANPTIISTDMGSLGDPSEAVENLPYLHQYVKKTLNLMSIKFLFPVQKSVIPWILEAHTKPFPFRPRDICVSAPTGSGKTLAFAIPIVQLLDQRIPRKVRALIVAPVAELAKQIYSIFNKLCVQTRLKAILLSTKTAFKKEQELLVDCYKGEFYSNVDIIITAPGRLVDHLHSTKGFCLKSLEFLVIDEADRIMDAVFNNWLYHLDSHVKTTTDMLLSGRSAPLCLSELEKSATTQPHKLLFSATLSKDPEKLQNFCLFQPKLFTSVTMDLTNPNNEQQTTASSSGFIGTFTTPAELTEKYCVTEAKIKPLTLYSLIEENGWTKFLCFTNSQGAAERLSFILQSLFQDSLKIAELSAALNGKKRAAALKRFETGLTNGLICSDALARGIDIPNVDYVISYDVPRDITTYIHRIGRTARAGRKGTAITLIAPSQLDWFNQVLEKAGKRINEQITVTSDREEKNAQRYSLALAKMREKLEMNKRTQIMNKALIKNAIPINMPAQKTLTEKLQSQAANELLQKAGKDKEAVYNSNLKKKYFKIKAYKMLNKKK